MYNLGLIKQQLKMITDCVALVLCFPCLSIVCIFSPCLIGGWNEKQKDLKGGPGLFPGSQCNLEQVTSLAGLEETGQEAKGNKPDNILLTNGRGKLELLNYCLASIFSIPFSLISFFPSGFPHSNYRNLLKM